MIMILSSTPLVSRLERFHCSIYIDLHTYIDSLYNYVGIYSVTEILCVCVCVCVRFLSVGLLHLLR